MSNYTAILLRGHTPSDWPKEGVYWCLHHSNLFEWTWDISKRIKFIHTSKAPGEQRHRCEMLRPVIGPLPPDMAKASVERAKASDEYDKTWAEYDKVGIEYDKTWAECAKASDEYAKARVEYAKALAECNAELIAQHNAEYPDTPWVGPTIFEVADE